MNNKDRIAATMYSLRTRLVSGVCVWIPCIKETMIMIMMMMMIISGDKCEQERSREDSKI
jgi:hypothetical protein